MKDDYKRERKLLRPGYSNESKHKGCKKINRKIVRAKLKTKLRKGEEC